MIKIGLTGGIGSGKSTVSFMLKEAGFKIDDIKALNSGQDENTKFIVTHFTHNAFAIHDDLCRAAEKHGFIVGYDGLTVEV